MTTFKKTSNNYEGYRETYTIYHGTCAFATLSFVKEGDAELKNINPYVIHGNELLEIQKFVEETKARFAEEDKTPLDKLLDAIDSTIEVHHGGTDQMVYRALDKLETALNNYRGGIKG